MRPKKPQATGERDLFRARIDQIINMKHDLVRLAGAIDWEWLDAEIAPLFSAKGRPASPTRFMIGLLLLKHVFALSDEQVCERWVYDPYFQYFTGEEFFQHAFPHERSDRVAGNDVLVIGPRAMTTSEERKDLHELYGVRAPELFTSQME